MADNEQRTLRGGQRLSATTGRELPLPTDQVAERFLVPNRAWRRIAASKTASAGTRQQLRNQWRRRPIGSTAPRRPAIANRGTPESNRGAGLQVRRRDGSIPGRRYPQPPRSARKPIEESFGRLPSPLATSTGCSKPATSAAAPLNPRMPGTDRAAAGRHQDGIGHRPGPERRPMQIDGFKRTRGAQSRPATRFHGTKLTRPTGPEHTDSGSPGPRPSSNALPVSLYWWRLSPRAWAMPCPCGSPSRCPMWRRGSTGRPASPSSTSAPT